MNKPTRAQVARKSDPTNASLAESAQPRVRKMPYDPDADAFHIDPKIIPRGFRYEWKRRFILGQPDVDNMSKLSYEGWRPVPSNRHPELAGGEAWAGLMPKTDFIERMGCILCERKEEDCLAVEDHFRRKTHDQTQAKLAEMGHSDDPVRYPRTKPEVRTIVEGPIRPDGTRGARAIARDDSGEDFED